MIEIQDIIAPTGIDHIDAMLKDENGNDITLVEAADHLFQAIWTDDAISFDTELRRVQALREKMFGSVAVVDEQQMRNWAPRGSKNFVPGMAGTIKTPVIGQKRAAPHVSAPVPAAPQGGKMMPALPPCRKAGEKELRKRLLTREMIEVLSQADGMMLSITQLCQAPRINMLKKYCIAKFSTYLEENSEKFERSQNPESPTLPDMVTLLMTDFEAQMFLQETNDEMEQYCMEYPELDAAGDYVVPAEGKAKAKRRKMQEKQQLDLSYADIASRKIGV